MRGWFRTSGEIEDRTEYNLACNMAERVGARPQLGLTSLGLEEAVPKECSVLSRLTTAE